MATVTGLTAAAMQEIVDSAIVTTDIVNDHLIVTRHDGSTYDAGNVRAPSFDTSPIGAVVTHTSQVIPEGHLVANGQVVSEVNWPQLATYAAAEVAAGNPLWAISGVAPN